MKCRDLIELLTDRFDGEAEVTKDGKPVIGAEYDPTYRKIELQTEAGPLPSGERGNG